MSEKTVDRVRRRHRVDKITGALASIRRSRQAAHDFVDDPASLSEAAFKEMTDGDKLRVLRRLRRDLVDQHQRYSSLVTISSTLGATLNRQEFLATTMEYIPAVVEAQRATLYLIHPTTGKLHGTIAQGTNFDLVLEPGEGIAGWVAEHGELLNVANAYEDERFECRFDSQHEFRTESVLCMPLSSGDGEVMAILQVLNSHNGQFSDDDEKLLEAIGAQLAIALETSELYHSLLDKNEELRATTERLEKKVSELDLLYEIQRDLSRPADLDSLVEQITEKTLNLVSGQACALTLREPGSYRVNALVDRKPGMEERDWDYYTRHVAPGDTVAQNVIETGESFICRTGMCRVLPGPSPDEQGLNVDNVVAVPLFDDGQCIGALKVYNLMTSTNPPKLGFTDDDVKVLTLIASQIAGAVAARRRKEYREKQDRLSTIGQMIAGILHDLKTPFSVISGYVELMASVDDAGRREEYAERILSQFRDINQMTRELLKFARGDSEILLRRVLVHQFMEEIAELLETEFDPYGISFEIDVRYRSHAHLDPVKMKRALLNLARNAAEATEPGGEVCVEVWDDDGQLKISFSDTGSGIPQEIRDRVFDSFVTQGKEDGTGIGLALVKKIIDEHGGTIDFETALGEGTTFYISMPLSPPDKQKKGEKR